MAKIGFLIASVDNSGGTERVLSILANHLVANNFQVSIVSLIGTGTPFFQFNKDIKIEYLYQEKPSFYKNFIDCAFKIRKFVKKQDIDTLIVVDSIQCLFSSAALFGLNIKHFCWEHFNFSVNDEGKNFLGYAIQFRKIARLLAARNCDQIITLTEKDKDLWIKGSKSFKGSIIAIPNPTPYENIESYPKFSNKTALALGRLTYQKSFDLLIDAWAEVCKVRSDWKLQIVGSGEDEQKLKQLVKNLSIENFVEFIPVSKNVVPYYEQASMYCMSSRFEGLPMVLLEAQAFGLPIVSFDCNTGPSDLINHAENGYLVECFDTQKFAQSLLQLMNLDEENYVAMCHKAKVKNTDFYSDKIIEKWIKILGS
jgi:glycosyltransferase involved in cell wall biosynthesis